MRFVQIRVAPGTGDTQVTFVTGAPEWERGREAAERALCIEKVTTVSAAFNDSPSPVAAAETELLGGESRLLAAAGGARFLLSPFTFFQTNTAALPLLVQAVRDLLPRKRDRLADLYSGAGLFALTLADSAGSVIAVEADPAAAEDLTRSARLCGAENVEVRRADSAEALKSLPVPDAAVLDPPRSGLSEAFFAAVRGGFQPPAFVLVSCSTASLGKDVEAFAAAGYRAARARPVDMFPHTPHLETVTLLIRA